MIITWHVDDLKMLHKYLGVVTGIIKCLCEIYGKLRISRGLKHEYLVTDLDYSGPGKVEFSMDSISAKYLRSFLRTSVKWLSLRLQNIFSPYTMMPCGNPSPRNKPRYSTGRWSNYYF